jgi:ParB family chromosome partitioning protein
LALKSPEEQLLVAETVLRRSATVRATEQIVARQLKKDQPRPKRATATLPATSATISEIQNRLQEHLGTRVTVHHGQKKGRIEIEYYGDDDLQRILGIIALPGSDA